MSGWKTKVGAILLGVSGLLKTLADSLGAPELTVYAEIFAAIGGPLTAVGVAHKVEKAGEKKS